MNQTETKNLNEHSYDNLPGNFGSHKFNTISKNRSEAGGEQQNQEEIEEPTSNFNAQYNQLKSKTNLNPRPRRNINLNKTVGNKKVVTSDVYFAGMVTSDEETAVSA